MIDIMRIHEFNIFRLILTYNSMIGAMLLLLYGYVLVFYISLIVLEVMNKYNS